MEQEKKWMRWRHRICTDLIRIPAGIISTFRYHNHIDSFKKQEGDRNWLILSNHQTLFDQFFVGLTFRKQVYYVAMEDLFSSGWISRVIEWMVAPIPILKATADTNAVRYCQQVAQEGGNIALFPEGNRTYSGRNCYIKPSVASMAKLLNLPIAIYRIEGGYGIQPRWADHCRKGRMRCGVRRVIEPEEYQNMSKEDLYSLICRELAVDETKIPGEYVSKHAAEGLERVLYVCPSCGISEFETAQDLITCKHCGQQYRYLSNKRLEAVKGTCPFQYVADWYEYQESFIRSMDLSVYGKNEIIFSDAVDLRRVFVFKNKRRVAKNIPIRAYADRVEFESDSVLIKLPYAEIKAMACIADHKLNIFHEDRVYQVRGGKSFNALKYCNVYYHAKYVKEEHQDGEFQFLGL